ncbi:MAG: TlpA disulfide reductase family protein [Bacillota bacterium]
MKSKWKFLAIPIVIVFLAFVFLDSDDGVVSMQETGVVEAETEATESEVAGAETESTEAESAGAESSETEQKDYHSNAIEVTFQTKTVYDEEITSDIFSEYDMTVMNVWATWCGPCVNEMPDLQEVYENLPENVNFISLCTDGVNSNSEARTILEESGATFASLLPDESLNTGLLPAISAYPTTLFIDKWGYAFTAITGAPPSDVAEVYLATIDDVLAELERMG